MSCSRAWLLDEVLLKSVERVMRLFVPTASIRNISSLVCTRNSLNPFGMYDRDDDRMIMMTISLMMLAITYGDNNDDIIG